MSRWKTAQAILNRRTQTVFGDSVNINGVVVNGIYKDRNVDPLGVSSESESVELLIEDADLLRINRRDPVVVNGEQFAVKDMHPNRTNGRVVIELQK